MTPTLDAVLRSWPWDPWLLAGLVLTVVAPSVVIVGELWKAFFGVRLSGR